MLNQQTLIDTLAGLCPRLVLINLCFNYFFFFFFRPLSMLAAPLHSEEEENDDDKGRKRSSQIRDSSSLRHASPFTIVYHFVPDRSI